VPLAKSPTPARSLLGLALAAVLVCGSLVSCATGSEVNAGPADGGITGHGDSGGRDTGKGDARHTSDGGEGGTLTPIGGSCASAVCAPPGNCTMLAGGQYCTEPCPSSGSCPTGTYCSAVNGLPLCIPYFGQECLICQQSTDCKVPTDACLTSPSGEHFCARDCTLDSVCPAGFTCETQAAYAASGAGGDGGAVEGGQGDAQVSDAGGQPMWCVPVGGNGCSCSSKNNGATETCSVTNMYGTCSAPATCDGATGMWMGCPAPASQEICNGKDDNCNGQVDEGNPNTLCAFMGAPPPNASWACTNGMCVLGACNAGWTNFPPGPASAGCACSVSATEPDATCAMATNTGSVSSVGGTPLVINGTLSSATDVNVFLFDTVDVNQTTTNSYHVTITFTAPTPNNEFVMDVIRGTPCVDSPMGGSTGITSYDWCVNATNATMGEAPCGPAGPHLCADHSSPYYLRVYRAAGVTPTCTPYQITITGGGGTCDLTQSCP